MIFGRIADDYTGASDLANTLSKCGLRGEMLLALKSENFGGADFLADALRLMQ